MFDLGSFSPLDASLNKSRLEDFQMINVPIIRSKAKKSKNIAATVRIEAGVIAKLKLLSPIILIKIRKRNLEKAIPTIVPIMTVAI